MDPLAVHDSIASDLLTAVLVAWFAFELVVRIRNPTPANRRDPTLLLVVVCLGGAIALDDWLSLLVLAVLPLTGILVRIRHEESVLLAALGDEYREYASQTRRLVPGVW